MGLQGDAVAHVGDGGACGLCMGVWVTRLLWTFLLQGYCADQPPPLSLALSVIVFHSGHRHQLSATTKADLRSLLRDVNPHSHLASSDLNSSHDIRAGQCLTEVSHLGCSDGSGLCLFSHLGSCDN